MASSVGSGGAVWVGHPWIVPAAVVRSLGVLIVGAVVVWLEFAGGVANDGFFGLNVWLWSVLVFLVVWALGLVDLLVLRFSHRYVLREDSLELKLGILSLHSYMIASSGFSDLEVIQSVTGRVLNYGDIVVRLQGARSQRMVLVREPFQVGDRIRTIMARPIVRVEGSKQP